MKLVKNHKNRGEQKRRRGNMRGSDILNRR